MTAPFAKFARQALDRIWAEKYIQKFAGARNWCEAADILAQPLTYSGPKVHAVLAQLVEHSIRNRKVVGSTPMDGSIIFNNLQARLLALLFVCRNDPSQKL